MSWVQRQPRKILLRSPNWVGDAIMATPVPCALKRTNPACQVHVLAKSWVAPIWERHPDVEQIVILDGKNKDGFFHWLSLVRKLRQEHYDLVLILPNSFSSAWLAFWSGCKKRVGYLTEHRGWLLNNKVPWNHSLKDLPRPKVYLNLARLAGADVDLCQEWNFTLKVSSEELAQADILLAKQTEKYIVGLAPGSVAPSRRWPVERYAQLADRLTEQGNQVVLVGSPADRVIAQAVAKRTKRKPAILAGTTNLREGLAVIRRLDLLVSNDSGAMHMAYAQGVPVLVLQGAADYRVTGPFGNNSYILRDEQLDCSPCVRNECKYKYLKCMYNLSVEQVWQEVQAILQKKKPAKNYGANKQ